MQSVRANLKFLCPFGGIISGPTMSGKSELVFQLIQNAGDVFYPLPDRIVYAYGVWQKKFEKYPPTYPGGLQYYTVYFNCNLY